MKKSELRNIIRESIKELVIEKENWSVENCAKACAANKLKNMQVDPHNIGAVFQMIFMECMEQCGNEWENDPKLGPVTGQ